jgi:hypothetical protein
MSDGAFLEALAACTLMAFVIAIHARLQKTGDLGSWPAFAARHPICSTERFS